MEFIQRMSSIDVQKILDGTSSRTLTEIQGPVSYLKSQSAKIGSFLLINSCRGAVRNECLPAAQKIRWRLAQAHHSKNHEIRLYCRNFVDTVSSPARHLNKKINP